MKRRFERKKGTFNDLLSGKQANMLFKYGSNLVHHIFPFTHIDNDFFEVKVLL